MTQAARATPWNSRAFFTSLAVRAGLRWAKRPYLLANPPRCLAGFASQPHDMPGVTFDGHGEELNTVFRLSCRCGHDQHYVLGHYWRNPDYRNVLVFLSPIALRCGACSRVTELIDTDIHGWDAEIGGIVATNAARANPQSTNATGAAEQPSEVGHGSSIPATCSTRIRSSTVASRTCSLGSAWWASARVVRGCCP